MLLGVNIDHVATVRNARGTDYPSPVQAALTAESAGADAITMHLREDRRHVSDNDVTAVRAAISGRFNLEMAMTEEMLEHALELRPQDVCIVPEKRRELTTEGGLDVLGQQEQLARFVRELTAVGTRVSLFVDPDLTQIRAAHEIEAPVVELHTGAYANAKGYEQHQTELEKVRKAVSYADGLGLAVNAGHGLNIRNVTDIAGIAEIHELNIGHAIIAQALFIGLYDAVVQMKDTIFRAHCGLRI